MESPSKHIERTLALPWVKGSDDPKNGGLDCWGAVVYSYKCIDCVTLPSITDREQCNLDASAKDAMNDYYALDEAEEGAIFCCYDADGCMVHIGRILCGQAYHAVGDESNPREVELWDISTLERVYSMHGGTVKYIQYKGA